MFSCASSVFWIFPSLSTQRWVNLSHVSWDILKTQSSCVWCAQSETPIKSHVGISGFSPLKPVSFSIDFSKFWMSPGLFKWRFLLPEPARWASFCTGFHVPWFCCNAFGFAPCSSCILTDGGLGSPWQDFHWHLPHPKRTSRACGMSQKQQIVFQGSWVSWSSWEASKDAGEPADVTARSLSAPRGLGHWKSLFMTGKMQILAGKEGKITPQGIFPFVIWGAKTSKAQHGLSQVLPIFPVKSFQWLTGVNNIPLLMEREGN